jgi:hypothetical protein
MFSLVETPNQSGFLNYTWREFQKKKLYVEERDKEQGKSGEARTDVNHKYSCIF